jgi:hypothetical protein
LYIAGAPIANTNITLTNSYALQVAAGPVQIDTSTAATSATTGALRVAGGVGISGALYAGGGIASANTTSGSLVVTGGLGVSGSSYHGGSVLITGTGGLGYGTGSGGTVTQATTSGKATGVTLSKTNGQITLAANALAASTTVEFLLTNTTIAATDILVLNHVSGGTAGSYTLNAQANTGNAKIQVRNVSLASLSEAIVIGFVVVKAATA